MRFERPSGTPAPRLGGIPRVPSAFAASTLGYFRVLPPGERAARPPGPAHPPSAAQSQPAQLSRLLDHPALAETYQQGGIFAFQFLDLLYGLRGVELRNQQQPEGFLQQANSLL